MPTNPERMIWGMGDATGLKVVGSRAGRLGSLICWESYMPLARYALYAQGMGIFVNPTWDKARPALPRHIAKEDGSWVIGTATALQGSDIRYLSPTRPPLHAGRVDQPRRCRGGECAMCRHEFGTFPIMGLAALLSPLAVFVTIALIVLMRD